MFVSRLQIVRQVEMMMMMVVMVIVILLLILGMTVIVRFCTTIEVGWCYFLHANSTVLCCGSCRVS